MLQSEELIAQFTAMAEAIKASIDIRSRGGSYNELATALYAALDQLDELDTAIARICT